MTDNLDSLRHIEVSLLGKDKNLYKLSTPSYYTAYSKARSLDFIKQHGKVPTYLISLILPKRK